MDNGSTEYIIETHDIVQSFPVSGGEFVALNNININIPSGKMTILKGRSGSGKTTLMNLLGALDRPKSGSILFKGNDIVAMSEKERENIRKKEVGFVFQSVALIPMMTAYENVEFALRLAGYKGNRKERTLQCLNLVGLSKRANHMPQELSGGEQQRVAIAIALANKPKLLLADEPTGSVDRNTSDYILDMFRKLNEELGITIVIVTHDQGLAKKVNRVVSIRDGKTSTERIMKNDYINKLGDVSFDWNDTEETQEEYAVLDRAGRLQIPPELLSGLGVDGNKVKLELKDGHIIIAKP